MLAGSAIPRHHGPSHHGLCQASHAHEKEQMAALHSNWTQATDPLQLPICSYLDHWKQQAGGLKAPLLAASTLDAEEFSLLQTSSVTDLTGWWFFAGRN